ncbi:MAG TPA: 4-hydroxythreonine-4-phosphate dehydrogenase PdxA [Methylophilaceae bacterium]|jgi:4-hydroxythreonine-4-phosphate dehydrogenase
MTPLPRIAITAGEPAGIGPDLCAMLQQQRFAADITIIADSQLLAFRAAQIGLPASNIKTRHVALKSPCVAGQLNAANSPYVLETLAIATQGCMTGEYDAMVTAPVHKGIINDAGISFTGHTEFLAELTRTEQVVMMLVGGGMRVALASIHLALSAVPGAITQDGLESTIKILHADLVHKFDIPQPHIFVAGLNPHAGEDGYLGTEEIDVINPVLQRLRQQGMQLTGALPADTMFSKSNLQQADCFLAMYHDQGLPVLKYASFGQGVNVTLGLPIIRTSVDHGTALDLAGSGKANPGSLIAAIELAIELANKRLT